MTPLEPERVRATPDYFLSVLQGAHLQSGAFDPEVDPSAALALDTTVAAWRRACDLLPAAPLGEALNREFGLSLPTVVWRSVLEPSDVRTLGDVCRVLAEHGLRERVRPAHLAGKACLSAGAFLTVRTVLERSGADVKGLRPSSHVRSYTKQHMSTFLGPISRFAPGVLVPVRRRPSVGSVTALAAGGAVVLVVAVWLSITAALFAGVAVVFLWTMITARLFQPVEFAGIETFGDLSRRVADAQARWD